MGFLKGVKRFSSRVIACSKKLKSLSSKCVKACARKWKSKTPKGDHVCTACSSRESKSKTPEKEKPKPAFMHATLMAEDGKKSSLVGKVRKLASEMSDDGLRSCVFHKDGKVDISGTIDPDRFFRRVEKLRKSEGIDLENGQIGKCSALLYKMKEAPSTNNANPPTNNTNTTDGYYQPQGYGYGNWGGYNNTGFYGNGGYYDYLAYNGGYNGNRYNYQPEPAVYQKRIDYDHIGCAGDDTECNFHHNEKAVTPDKTEDKSSENTVPKPTGSRKRN